MPLKNLLKTIAEAAEPKNISKPYLVGGFCRDVFMKDLKKIDDLDITCGDETIHLLAKNVSKMLGSSLIKFPDGHSKINYGKYKIDFSSNFKIPNIKEILIRSGIKNPTNMQQEIYSRDFTINTLLMPMNLSSVIDVTGFAMNDIKNRKIDTCLSPKITFSYDPKRIIRVVYLAAKLRFIPSLRVVKWIRENNKAISLLDEEYIKSKLDKAVIKNPQVTKKMIQVLNIKNKLPYIRGI
jgi:tRNA nucleotidyltransferase/poly(A) polymerase